MKKRSMGLSARLVVLTVVVLTSGALIASAPAASPAPRSSAKVDARVTQQVRAQGSATFWALFTRSADLRPAFAIADWTARGIFVLDALRSTADDSQRTVRAILNREGVANQAFWIVNGIRVVNGTAQTLAELSARPEVSRIVPDWQGPVIQPIAGTARIKSVDGVEWNIKNIQANKVWRQFGDRGQDSVVGSIDTGVQFDHPALVNQYRGNLHNGSFDHNYNWWDPSHFCPQPKPCDNVDHGTHTMGTMV